VYIPGHKEKRGSTVTLTVTKSNTLLPAQIIWSGLTKSSIPVGKLPSGFLNSFAGNSATTAISVKKSNSWQNRKTILEYARFIISPYLKEIREDDNGEMFPKGNRAAILWDQHWSHECEVIKLMMESMDVDIYFIPAKATDLYSVLDVSINKPFKSQMKSQYNGWTTSRIAERISKGVEPTNISTHIKTSILKPLALKWIIKSWEYLKDHEEFISNGWKKVDDHVYSWHIID